MNKSVAVFAVVLALAPQAARPDGCYFPRQEQWKRQRERSLISEPAQKAAIFYRGGREQLIISPSYQGPPGGFAWVVPVPSRPRVKVLGGALFHELARVVEPAPPPAMSRARRTGETAASTGPPVTILERETVGAYDVSVLATTDGGALQAWLAQNGYALPDAARRPLAEYVREKWTFVACRIKVPRTASGLQQGTLAPLSLTFPTPGLVYPMRLSSASLRPFRLVLYLLCAPDAGRPVLKTWPGRHPLGLRDAPALPGNAPEVYPTLSGLGARGLSVQWAGTTVAPRDCTRDYVWSLRGKNGR